MGGNRNSTQQGNGELMQMQLELDTGGAPAGNNRQALVADVQAEIDKLAAAAGATTAKPAHQPVPKGAQGDVAVIHWLVKLATNPSMSVTYAKALIFALNTILQAAKSKKAVSKAEDKKPSAEAANMPEEKPRLTIKFSVGDLVLPATTAAIKIILDKLGDGS
jgi:hypothetical protein